VASEDEGNHMTRTGNRASSCDFGGRKLHIPIFRGDDACGWIVRAERYFKLNLMEDDEKHYAVVITLEDKFKLVSMVDRTES